MFTKNSTLLNENIHSFSSDDVSVIIPLAPQEKKGKALVRQLIATSFVREILLVTSVPNHPVRRELPFSPLIRFIYSPQGRGVQLNTGADQASGKILWFLHADSLLPEIVPNGPKGYQPGHLNYFDLRFTNDGPPLMFLNTIGVWIRSHFFSLPFGDQGLILEKSLFVKSGNFPENGLRGEDLLFVTKLRNKGVPFNCLKETIWTSARKYRQFGWLKTTCQHLKYTLIHCRGEKTNGE